MINDFTFLYGNASKVKDAFGNINEEMLLRGAKSIFGGQDQVFFEYGRDETNPLMCGACNVDLFRSSGNSGVVSISKSQDGRLVLTPLEADADGSLRYNVSYRHQFCNFPIANKLYTKETKKYFSVDLEYILRITRAMTTYDFSEFSGEGKRILKAWIFVMTYGSKHPDEPDTIMLHSSRNEYGEPVSNRVIVRNSYYEEGKDHTYLGAPYAESRDPEWALTADDYSRVAALDRVFTELSLGSPLLYNNTIVPSLIHDSIDYGDTVPGYLKSILEMRKQLKNENTQGY